MKTFYASAIAMTIAATGAWAESHASENDMMTRDNNASMAMMDMQDDLIRTRDITGGNVYTTNVANDEDWTNWDSDEVYDSVDNEWTQIGEIEDIVLSRSGEMKGLVVEVGGFLDIGDKHVMISVDDVSLVAVDDQTYGYVTRLSEEQLESMDAVDEGFWN